MKNPAAPAVKREAEEDWNKALDPAGRYAAVMAAPGLFDVAAAP